METAVFEIELNDGSIYRIYCANRSQKKRFFRTLTNLRNEDKVKKYKTLTNGIHNISQWEKQADIL